MVRKSERNKPQGTPEKVVAERTRKSTRQSSRRKKKSSSESEGEPDVLVDKDIKEVGELSESKPQTEPEGPEVKQDGARSRRSIKRHPAALQSDKEQDHEQNSEWKEDPSFWHSEGPAPQETTGESKVPGDVGTTWKIQSSNGSGGEIQKLKICRQRVSESNDSSSPSKEASPKRRKSTRLTKNLETPMDTTEPEGDILNEKKEENTSEEIMIPGLGNSDSLVMKIDSGLEFLSGSQCDVNEGDIPESNSGNDKSVNIEENSGNGKSVNIEDNSGNDKSVNIEENSGNGKSVNIEENPGNGKSVNIEDNSGNGKSVNIKDNSLSSSLCNDSKLLDEKNDSVSEEAINTSMISQVEIEIQNPQSNENSSRDKLEESKDSNSPRRSSTEMEPSNVENLVERRSSQDHIKPDQETEEGVANNILNEDSITLNNEERIDQPNLESQSEETTTNRSRTVSENSEDGKDERNVNITKVKLSENNETTKDEIINKLNERAARLSKELNENKDIKKKEEAVSLEPKSPREEGELTPVLETKKPKHTTIVINRPKEVSSQPTKLKRNTEDLPPSERKRRLVSKPKPKDKEEDPINISSQSLMLLVPEVKTITPEEVASFPLEDEDLTKFEMEQPSEICTKKKLNLKTKDVEIRVQNDNRQVFKKKHIVIDASNDLDEMKTVGPKLPLQENHRVIRKISLLSEDVKKVHRSPSPGKAATEVLFITNLVRPFTIPQLRELLARTGTIASNGFYIDKIKSKCYVKYTDVEMAVETRHALNGVRWPVNNPKMLKVEFATAEDMAIVQKLAEEETVIKKPEAAEPATPVAGWLSEQAALKPQRRVTTAVREWDMGKVGTGAATEEKRNVEEWHVKPEPQEVKRRAASPVETKYEPPARKIKKRDNDAPARLLDDLFRKTKATPCIYWLPLTAAQIAVKEEMRRQHMAEHERRLAELRKSDHSRREKDREKSRDSRRKK